MTGLAIAGALASCSSCVESWYLTSAANAQCFLDAMTTAGLLRRVPLFRLLGGVGRLEDLPPADRALAEPIYVPSPEFAQHSPDIAQDRIIRTREAVLQVIHAYVDRLRRDDRRIDAAWNLVLDGTAGATFRFADVARIRRTSMTALARLRLVIAAVQAPGGDAADSARRAQRINSAVEFILSLSADQIALSERARPENVDLSSEIDEFGVMLLSGLTAEAKTAVSKASGGIELDNEVGARLGVEIAVARLAASSDEDLAARYRRAVQGEGGAGASRLLERRLSTFRGAKSEVA